MRHMDISTINFKIILLFLFSYTCLKNIALLKSSVLFNVFTDQCNLPEGLTLLINATLIKVSVLA